MFNFYNRVCDRLIILLGAHRSRSFPVSAPSARFGSGWVMCVLLIFFAFFSDLAWNLELGTWNLESLAVNGEHRHMLLDLFFLYDISLFHLCYNYFSFLKIFYFIKSIKRHDETFNITDIKFIFT